MHLSSDVCSFQVINIDDEQKNALRNLPGRHLWRRDQLAAAIGHPGDNSALFTRLKKLFGRDWKEKIGIKPSKMSVPKPSLTPINTVVCELFRGHELHFETVSLRDQNSTAGALNYDAQSLVDVRNLILSNSEIFGDVLRSFSSHLPSAGETAKRAASLDIFKVKILPELEKTRAWSVISNLGVITADLTSWQKGIVERATQSL